MAQPVASTATTETAAAARGPLRGCRSVRVCGLSPRFIPGSCSIASVARAKPELMRFRVEEAGAPRRMAMRSSASRERSRTDSGNAESTFPGGRRDTIGCGRVGAMRRTASQAKPSSHNCLALSAI
jgi:hypothetical protein